MPFDSIGTYDIDTGPNTWVISGNELTLPWATNRAPFIISYTDKIQDETEFQFAYKSDTPGNHIQIGFASSSDNSLPNSWSRGMNIFLYFYADWQGASYTNKIKLYRGGSAMTPEIQLLGGDAWNYFSWTYNKTADTASLIYYRDEYVTPEYSYNLAGGGYISSIGGDGASFSVWSNDYFVTPGTVTIHTAPLSMGNNLVVQAEATPVTLSVSSTPSGATVYYTLNGGSEVSLGESPQTLFDLSEADSVVLRLTMTDYNEYTSSAIVIPAATPGAMLTRLDNVRGLTNKVDMSALTGNERALIEQDPDSYLQHAEKIEVSPGTTAVFCGTGESVTLSAASSPQVFLPNMGVGEESYVTLPSGASVTIEGSSTAGEYKVGSATITSTSSVSAGGYVFSISE